MSPSTRSSLAAQDERDQVEGFNERSHKLPSTNSRPTRPTRRTGLNLYRNYITTVRAERALRQAQDERDQVEGFNERI